jgi:hypothetical protein
MLHLFHNIRRMCGKAVRASAVAAAAETACRPRPLIYNGNRPPSF